MIDSITSVIGISNNYFKCNFNYYIYQKYKLIVEVNEKERKQRKHCNQPDLIR